MAFNLNFKMALLGFRIPPGTDQTKCGRQAVREMSAASTPPQNRAPSQPNCRVFAHAVHILAFSAFSWSKPLLLHGSVAGRWSLINAVTCYSAFS
jgi:hypothetical protein